MPQPASPDPRRLQLVPWYLLVSTRGSAPLGALETSLLDESQKAAPPKQEIPAPAAGPRSQAPAEPRVPPTGRAGGGRTARQCRRLGRPEPPASDWLPGTRGLPEACVFGGGCSGDCRGCPPIRSPGASRSGNCSERFGSVFFPRADPEPRIPSVSGSALVGILRP